MVQFDMALNISFNFDLRFLTLWTDDFDLRLYWVDGRPCENPQHTESFLRLLPLPGFECLSAKLNTSWMSTFPCKSDTWYSGTVHSVYCIQTVNELNSEHQRSSGIRWWTLDNLAKFVNTLYSRRAGGEDCSKGWAEHPGWATRQTSASLSSLLALLLASNHWVVRKHTI